MKVLIQMPDGDARSYLDALSEYESVTTEAIALARGQRSRGGIKQRVPLDLDVAWGPEAGAVEAVMLRWHLSLVTVLKTAEQMFQRPLESTIEDTQPKAIHT